MGHVARTPAPGGLFARFERYNGMTPPFGITMLRSFKFRHHDVAIVTSRHHDVAIVFDAVSIIHKEGLIGFANVAIGNLFNNLSCRRVVLDLSSVPSSESI
jgi:hypothetical protein